MRGDVDVSSLMNEDCLLELEHKYFMELIAQGKMRKRIEYMLKHGKPLRD